MIQRVVKLELCISITELFREGEMFIGITGGGRITGWTEGLRAFFHFFFFSFIHIPRKTWKEIF